MTTSIRFTAIPDGLDVDLDTVYAGSREWCLAQIRAGHAVAAPQPLNVPDPEPAVETGGEPVKVDTPPPPAPAPRARKPATDPAG